MAKRIRSVGIIRKKIRSIGTINKKVDLTILEKKLGAEKIGIKIEPGQIPISLLALQKKYKD